MIPKKIHYCWFGNNPMPDLVLNCIASWEKNLPEYELILWDETSIDIESVQFIREAYAAKQYAFVSDYVRLFALYHHGGIYLDTDVEVLKSFDVFLSHQAFIGNETSNFLGAATIGAEKYNPWIKDVLDHYDNKSFITASGEFDRTTIPIILTGITQEKYGWLKKNEYQLLKGDLHTYPLDYFIAKDPLTMEDLSTKNTYAIHHYENSWQTSREKFNSKVTKLMGPKLTKLLTSLKDKLQKLRK